MAQYNVWANGGGGIDPEATSKGWEAYMNFSAGPFPVVVEVEDGMHAPFCHLGEEIVQSFQQCDIQIPRRTLECRLHRAPEGGILRSSKDPQILDAVRFQDVELTTQTIAIPALPG
jgi:hypothetical protein